MNVIFMGSPDFAIPCLEQLLHSPHQVRAVVTVPDKPAGRGKQMTASAVKRAALEHGLAVLQPEALSDPGFLTALSAFQADLFVVVAFRILPAAVFKMPAFGAINVHASLLPKYRGAAPINWALMNGDTETGVTTFLIDEKVDTGNILLQKAVHIRDDMVAGELYETLRFVGAELLLETVNGLAEQRLSPQLQVGVVTAAPKIHKDMGCIDWRQPTEKIYNLYRGLTPVPGVFGFLQDRLFKFSVMQRMRNFSATGYEPGRIITDGKTSLAVVTGDGALAISKIQPEGKRVMDTAEFLRGTKIQDLEHFHSRTV
jgi:methionyl-tRNA formyltransferase